MTDYLTEQEQIQQLKNWVKQYGMAVLIGIVIALTITSGWHYWQAYRNKILQHASAVYDEMITMRAQNNSNGAVIQAQKLLRNYAKTPYADMAAFMLAREAVLAKNYKEAIKQLQWVIGHTKNEPMREIARTRAARILITENKPDDAIALLAEVKDKSFKGLADEIRGDALLIKNDKTQARKAYELALQNLPNAEISRPILEMKFDNLAT